MVLTNDQKICKQVEFYFSDSNLPYDKFLWTLRANSEGGWIPIETIAGFKKIKLITDDIKVIVNALKNHNSELYELDAEDKNIRRKTEVVEQDHTARSVYIKGLPLVDKDEDPNKDRVVALFELQDQIDEAFSEKGKVLCVRLKKMHTGRKNFKGTAYVEFDSPEKAKEIAALKEMEINGHKVEIIYKPTYNEIKAEKHKDVQQNPANSHKKYSFNAFKPSQPPTVSGAKRKSISGFETQGGKKSKKEEVKS